MTVETAIKITWDMGSLLVRGKALMGTVWSLSETAEPRVLGLPPQHSKLTDEVSATSSCQRSSHCVCRGALRSNQWFASICGLFTRHCILGVLFSCSPSYWLCSFTLDQLFAQPRRHKPGALWHPVYCFFYFVSFTDFFYLFASVWGCISLYANVHVRAWREKESVSIPGTGVTGGCEP